MATVAPLHVDLVVPRVVVGIDNPAFLVVSTDGSDGADNAYVNAIGEMSSTRT